jgi:hypothetical protein
MPLLLGCADEAFEPIAEDQMDTERDQLPTYYDGTQLVIRIYLPDRSVSIADVYDHVYGMHLAHGAKPWPYYRDAKTGEWWSLSAKDDTTIDGLVWMIPLDQLRYQPRPDAKEFLETVYPELRHAAKQFGGTAVPECDIADALEKMGRVVELQAIRDFQMTILVSAPDGGAYTVAEWWRACEKSGLTYGDGNLFWLINESASEDHNEPYEYFSVEPFSKPGYFHRGDLGASVTFPDVALSFRVRDFNDPHAVLEKMVTIADALANHLGANLLASNGDAFDSSTVRQRLEDAIQKLHALKNAR